MPWDDMDSDGRRSVAHQWDYQNDPAKEEDRQYWWDFFVRKDEIKKQIVEWQAVQTPTASDLTQKEVRLAELEDELATMEQQAKGDVSRQRKRTGENGETSPVAALGLGKSKCLLDMTCLRVFFGRRIYDWFGLRLLWGLVPKTSRGRCP